MTKFSPAQRTLSAGFLIIAVVLGAISLSILRSGTAAQGSTSSTSKGKAVSTRAVPSAGSRTPAQNPYTNFSVPIIPAGVGALPTDVGPAAASRPAFPAPKPTSTKPVSSVADLNAAIADAQPGVAIELADGVYEGAVVVAANGTAEAPIVIRSRKTHGAVFQGASSFVITGQYVTIEGLKFVRTGAKTIEIAALGTRLTDNVFEDCGNGASGSSTGLIFSDNALESDPNGLRRPIIQRKSLIEGNTFVRPKNTVVWQNHGLVGNTIIGNRIQGPHGITDGETEAIKIGFGFQLEPTNTIISYNEITDWEGWPYVIGIKSSAVTLTKNVIGGRVVIRYGDNVTISDNVILHGDLVLSGDRHTIERNVIISSKAKDAVGPLVVLATAAFTNELGVFDGVSAPMYYRTLTNSTVRDNSFVSLDPQDAGTVFFLGLGEANYGVPPKNNQITRNLFARTSSPELFLNSSGTPTPPRDLLVNNGNSWSANVFMCSASCTASQVATPGLVGTNGNLAADGTRAAPIGAGINGTGLAKNKAVAAATLPKTPAKTTTAKKSASKKPSTTAKRSTTTKKRST
jgi:signal peptidase I